MILGTFALAFPPQDAAAGHANACAKIEILKNDVPVVTYDRCIACNENNCNVTIDVSKRHEALFKRACGDAFTINVIVPTQTQKIELCDLPHGPWDVRTTGTINTTHGSTINLRVISF